MDPGLRSAATGAGIERAFGPQRGVRLDESVVLAFWYWSLEVERKLEVDPKPTLNVHPLLI